jgi:hypothetical protein
MDRRRFISSVPLGLLAAPLAAGAQSPPTVRRIGVVGGGVPDQVEARKEGLRRLGWVEGQNIVVEYVNLERDHGPETGRMADGAPYAAATLRTHAQRRPASREHFARVCHDLNILVALVALLGLGIVMLKEIRVQLERGVAGFRG